MAEHIAETHAAEVDHSGVFYQEPTFWVAVAFVIFFAFALKPLVKIITGALDKRSAEIAAELAEASRLRAEAEAILASFQKKQRESLQEAEAMLAETRNDAVRIMEKAEADLKKSLEKRMQMAMDKIAQAETRAMQDVQAQVADIALNAASKLIAEHLDKGGNDELVRQAAADVAAKIH